MVLGSGKEGAPSLGIRIESGNSLLTEIVDNSSKFLLK